LSLWPFIELPNTFGAAIGIPRGSLLKELELFAGGQVTAFLEAL
jgi:hypothetical protein